MEVYTVDGRKRGKISELWQGTSVGGPDANDQESCEELHHGLLGHEVISLPSHVIQSVDEICAMLSVDEQTLKETASWHHKPAWMS